MLIRAVKRLVETQIREADVCFVNKVDAATPEEIAKTEAFIREINKHAEIAHMSAETGEGIAHACDLIETGTSPRYDDSVEAERLKNEYNGGE